MGRPIPHLSSIAPPFKDTPVELKSVGFLLSGLSPRVSFDDTR